MGYLSKSGLQILWTQILNMLKDKVDVVDGKGLSTNDYTTEEKEKLAELSTEGLATEDYVDESISTSMEGVVKSVNGVTPDESGEIKFEKLLKTTSSIEAEQDGTVISNPARCFNIVDGSNFGIPLNTYNQFTAKILNDTFTKGFINTRFRRSVMTDNGNIDYYCTKVKKITQDKWAYYFGDDLAPIIADSVNNTFELDPDWVAPSEPEKYVMFRSIKGETTVEAFGAEWLWGMADGSYSGNDLHMEHVVIDNDKGIVINYDKTGYEVISLVYDNNSNPIQYIVKFYFGDNACPVIADLLEQEITLDPDWVAPTACVKTINSTTPDENGNIELIENKKFRFADGTKFMPNLLTPYWTETITEIVNMLRGSAHDVIIERIIMEQDGSSKVRYYTGYEFLKDESNQICGAKVFFDDDLFPVIFDIPSNKISVDPDWVAPEVLPETSEAHQMLVTDGEGNTVWEERIIRPPESSVVTIIPEQTIVPDYENNGGSAFITEAPIEQLIARETYIVNWNGTEYKVVAQDVTENGITLPIIGDIGLMTGSGSTGEPFIIYTVPDDMIENMDGARVVVAALDQSTSVTFKVDKGSITYHRLPYEYLPEDLYRTEREETILLPTNTPTLTDNGYAINIPLKQELVLGETYTVIWNGVAYECEYKSLTETTEDGAVVNANFLGNESALGIPSTSDAPFIIIFYMTIGGINMMPEGVYGMCMPTDETTEITLSISGMGEVVYKVPDKYLPPKTHWVNEEDKIILPETTFTGLSSTGIGVNASLNHDLEVGTQYTVIWNDTEYTSTAQAPLVHNGVFKVVLGNGKLFGGTQEDVPYCFGVLTFEGMQSLGYPYFLTSSDAEATMKIIEPAGTVHKLDKKFIPAEDFIINLVNGNAIGSLRNIYSTEENDKYNIGEYAIAEGYKTIASGDYSHAEGKETIARGMYSHAEGYLTTASGDCSHTEGYKTVASGSNSHAEGSYAEAIGSYSHAEGCAKAEGEYSHSEGANSVAIGEYSHAEGRNTKTNGLASHAEGNGTVANDNSSHAEGIGTIANGLSSHAEGTDSIAIGSYSHAEGYNRVATGRSSHAEGESSIYTLNLSGEANATTYNFSTSFVKKPEKGHIIRLNKVFTTIIDTTENTITVQNTLSSEALSGTTVHLLEGNAFGDFSHAEGYKTIARGDSSHAEGRNTETNGLASHARGQSTKVNGAYGTAIGMYNIDNDDVGYYVTEREGHISYGKTATYAKLAEVPTLDLPNGVFIYGEKLDVKGSDLKSGDIICFHSSTDIYYVLLDVASIDDNKITFNTRYKRIHSFANEKGKYLLMAGNGTADDARSNAHTLDWSGNAWYQGDVYTGGTSQDDAERLAKVSEITAPRDHLTLTDRVTGKTYAIAIENGNLISILIEEDNI